MRRFVPADLHGLLDNMTVGLFLCGGKLFRIDENVRASVVPDKPFGGVRLIPMKQHLAMDAMFGLAVGLAPWLSGSWRKGWNYWAPQTFAMTSEVFFALTTKTD
jgi:hypothetical protein